MQAGRTAFVLLEGLSFFYEVKKPKPGVKKNTQRLGRGLLGHIFK